MEMVPVPPDRVQDPFEKNVPGIGVGRDGSRAPMQWSISGALDLRADEGLVIALAPDAVVQWRWSESRAVRWRY